MTGMNTLNVDVDLKKSRLIRIEIGPVWFSFAKGVKRVKIVCLLTDFIKAFIPSRLQLLAFGLSDLERHFMTRLQYSA